MMCVGSFSEKQQPWCPFETERCEYFSNAITIQNIVWRNTDFNNSSDKNDFWSLQSN